MQKKIVYKNVISLSPKRTKTQETCPRFMRKRDRRSVAFTKRKGYLGKRSRRREEIQSIVSDQIFLYKSSGQCNWK